jgi:lincosamide nucleotidyltransferase A/C/D/E
MPKDESEMTASDVIEILRLLDQNRIDVWIDGGWGVDALLGEQTRIHRDLDIAVQHRHVPRLRALLEARGYKDVPRDDTRDCNFVLGDDLGHQIDVHSYTFDSAGNHVYGVEYPAESLAGTGSVNGNSVRCISPEWMVSLPAYIAARLPLLPAEAKSVLLHGDVRLGNLLLAQEKGCWMISGLFDFGYSLCGFHEYEFVAPGALMVQGNRQLQRAFLLAYGYKETELDLSLRARLMLLTVLYECSDLRKYAMRLTPEAVNFTLNQLEAAIWTFAADDQTVRGARRAFCPET